MPLAAREFDLIVRKFGFETRTGSHLFAWLTLDGKRRRTNTAFVERVGRLANGAQHPPTAQTERHTAKRDAIRCTMNLEGYIQMLRDRGIA